jgi:hypothetical protein
MLIRWFHETFFHKFWPLFTKFAALFLWSP